VGLCVCVGGVEGLGKGGGGVCVGGCVRGMDLFRLYFYETNSANEMK
jgi:hypothetical protein